ncbi:MAG: bifunctional phosphopantothenoylcysteine decarboxylase/phosphopantothenate--cysteine ligase CoaBC [Candidatus Caldatribacteriota bacterium]|nr:bifunctional phosphopantothenoylcysteine decarboxylase/phosphopantothenate--cysteine ligase CoaBC [Candidatus Caldatribacteriota bacterium]
MLKGKKIVLGITGSISAYKGVEILSLLKKKGAEVIVVMTKSAEKFVQPLTFATISGRPVIRDLFSLDDKLEVKHISLTKWADLILIAPATANIVSKIANGIADDILTATVLAAKVKTIFAPAMNKNMITNPIYLENVRKLISFGYEFIDSEYGVLACGDVGKGRLANTKKIISTIKCANLKKDYKNKTVLITASCTREPIDKVRFISNYSSGKMGFALAKIASDRGAKVILISGPHSLPSVKVSKMILIETAEEMKKEVLKYFPKADIIISAAAIADFRPKKSVYGKIKKSDNRKIMLELEETSDILAELGKKKGKKILIGFAAETDNLIKNASKKLKEKNLNLIIANNILAKDAGFGSDKNRAKIINSEGKVKNISLMEKSEMAIEILDEILKVKQKRN